MFVSGSYYDVHRILRAIAVILLVVAVLAPVAASAQQPASPEPTARESIEDLISTLEDESARQRLLDQLKTLLAAQGAAEEQATAVRPEGFLGILLVQLSTAVEQVASHLGETIRVLIGIPEAAGQAWEQIQEPQLLQSWLEVIGKVVLILLGALLAEAVARRLLARARRSLAAREGENHVLRWVLVLARAALDVVPIAAFAAVAYAILAFSDPRYVTRLAALAIINANIIVRLVLAIANALLMPSNTGVRPLRMSDESANYAAIWVHRLTSASVYGYFFAEAALLLGLPWGAYQVLLRLVGLVVTGLAVVLVLQNRTPICERIRGRPAANGTARFAALRQRLAEVWHVLAIVFLAAVYGVWALGAEGGFSYLATNSVLTAIAAIAAGLLLSGVRRAFNRGFRVSEDLRLRFPGLEERANRYVAGAHTVLRATIYVIAGLVIANIWFGAVFAWIGSETGRFVTQHVASILLIVVSALVVWELSNLLIEHYLNGRGRDGAEIQRSARIRTLLPLLRNVVSVVLAVIVVLTVLSELGVNIAPLLAGAGVVGLAIGFGAQSLVKDVITGTFILVEDAISIGDVVDLGGHSGVVESMTIRSIRLRDLSGNVHLIPFGQVGALINMTKGFAFASLDVGVAYREDVDEVVEVLKGVSEGMREDAVYGPLIIEPLEVLGLDSFGDSSVNIKVRLKTLPSKQWMVRREFNRRMKRAFDEKGIEIPFPHRTLVFAVDKQGRTAELNVRQIGGPAEASP